MASETTNRMPLIKELTDEELRTHYRGLRGLSYNNAQMAMGCSSGGRTIRILARQQGRLLKHIGICEAVARQRRISLV